MERELWVVEERFMREGDRTGAEQWEPLSWCAYPTKMMGEGGMRAWDKIRQRFRPLRVVRYVPEVSDDG